MPNKPKPSRPGHLVGVPVPTPNKKPWGAPPKKGGK